MGRTRKGNFRVIIPKDVKKEIIKLPKEYRNSLKEIFRTLREDFRIGREGQGFL